MEATAARVRNSLQNGAHAEVIHCNRRSPTLWPPRQHPIGICAPTLESQDLQSRSQPLTPWPLDLRRPWVLLPATQMEHISIVISRTSIQAEQILKFAHSAKTMEIKTSSLAIRTSKVGANGFTMTPTTM